MSTASCQQAGSPPHHDQWIHPRLRGLLPSVDVLSRVFRGKFVEALRRAYDQHELDLDGGSEHLQAPKAWHALCRRPLRNGVGRVRQAGLRWSVRRSCAISGVTPIASRSAITACSPSMASVSPPMEGLGPWRPAPHDDAHRDGVSPPLRPAHLAARLRPHPPVRLPRQYLSDGARDARPHGARRLHGTEP